MQTQTRCVAATVRFRVTLELQERVMNNFAHTYVELTEMSNKVNV